MPALQAQAPGRLDLVAAAATGLCAQTVQVVCLREIFQVARGGEAVLGIALASWLLGSGLGAATWRFGRVSAAALVMAVPLALVALLRAMAPGHGAWAPAAALLAGVAAYPAGAYFATVLRHVRAHAALMWEALGACLAGGLLSVVLLTAVDAFALLVVGGCVCVLGAGRARTAAVLLLLLLACPAAERATFALNSDDLWPGSEVVRAVESPYGRQLWLARGTQHALFSNGRLVLTLPDRIDAEAFVNVVLAAHPAPRRVLVLGIGGIGLLHECLRHPIERLEFAVQDASHLELLRPDLDERDRGALQRARLRTGDLRRIAAADPRDVVLVLAGEPLTLASNRFYTREFFDGVSLADGGIVAFALPGAANAREGEILARNVAVFRAARRFRVRVLPGPADIFLAGAGDVSPVVLAARLRARGIEFAHHAPDFFAEAFRTEEVERVTRVYAEYPRRPPPAVPFALEPTRAAGPAVEPLPNSDLQPGAVLHAAAALARREQVPWLAAATGVAATTPWIMLAVAFAGLLWTRRGVAAVLTVATTGAASMGLWVVLLMLYQARVGALYGDLALLAAAFMAGFAIGTRLRASVLTGDIVLLIVCALPVLVPAGGTVVIAVLVGVAGGMSLANTVASRPESAARLYAWDLAGAAVAALFFGSFLLPAVGVVGACATIAALKLVSVAGQLLSMR